MSKSESGRKRCDPAARGGPGRRSGQSMAEYAIALCVLVLASAAVFALVRAVNGKGARDVALVSSEFP